jgi:hypothetical protein
VLRGKEAKISTQNLFVSAKFETWDWSKYNVPRGKEAKNSTQNLFAGAEIGFLD